MPEDEPSTGNSAWGDGDIPRVAGRCPIMTGRIPASQFPRTGGDLLAPANAVHSTPFLCQKCPGLEDAEYRDEFPRSLNFYPLSLEITTHNKAS